MTSKKRIGSADAFLLSVDILCDKIKIRSALEAERIFIS